MNVSRYFLLIAIVYLLAGMMLGDYMGGSEDFTLKAVHAHINLVGFTLMAVFAAIYKVFPAMAASRLATVHFWLHQLGAILLVTGLYLFFSGNPLEETLEIPIFVGFSVGLYGGRRCSPGTRCATPTRATHFRTDTSTQSPRWFRVARQYCPRSGC